MLFEIVNMNKEQQAFWYHHLHSLWKLSRFCIQHTLKKNLYNWELKIADLIVLFCMWCLWSSNTHKYLIYAPNIYEAFISKHIKDISTIPERFLLVQSPSFVNLCLSTQDLIGRLLIKRQHQKNLWKSFYAYNN